MRITTRHNDTIVEIHIGACSVRSVETDIEALRRQCGLDLLTSIPVFLANAVRWDLYPVALLMHRGTVLYGVVMLYGHKKYGIPTGVLKSGYNCGRGTAMAINDAEYPAIAEIAARVLVRRFLAHSVTISLIGRETTAHQEVVVPAREVMNGRWFLGETRSCVYLEGGMEGLMSSNMRRNLKRYRRKAEQELRCVFIPQLSAMQSQQAVAALNDQSHYPLPNARRQEAALRATPNSFAMGLQDGKGAWLSYLAGWREAGVTYIEWQSNLTMDDSTSLTTVMRAYCLEHEITNGTQRIIFPGGATEIWRRVCVPQTRSVLIVLPNGLIGLVARTLARWLSPSGQIAKTLSGQTDHLLT